MIWNNLHRFRSRGIFFFCAAEEFNRIILNSPSCEYVFFWSITAFRSCWQQFRWHRCTKTIQIKMWKQKRLAWRWQSNRFHYRNNNNNDSWRSRLEGKFNLNLFIQLFMMLLSNSMCRNMLFSSQIDRCCLRLPFNSNFFFLLSTKSNKIVMKAHCTRHTIHLIFYDEKFGKMYAHRAAALLWYSISEKCSFQFVLVTIYLRCDSNERQTSGWFVCMLCKHKIIILSIISMSIVVYKFD